MSNYSSFKLVYTHIYMHKWCKHLFVCYSLSSDSRLYICHYKSVRNPPTSPTMSPHTHFTNAHKDTKMKTCKHFSLTDTLTDLIYWEVRSIYRRDGIKLLILSRIFQDVILAALTECALCLHWEMTLCVFVCVFV